MQTILVLGSTGSLGSSILAVLRQHPYRLRATARTALKAEQLLPSVDEVVVCDPTNPDTLTPALLEGVDYIISALGKSLSLSDDSRTSFHEVNFKGNLNVLNLAQAHGQIKKFIYVAAFNSEHHSNVAYFKAHEDFTKALRKSEIPNSIIKPPALFSAFLNLLPLARKGHLASFGSGNAITNPIHEHEVAEACVQALTLPVATIELGGPVAYSRLQLAELVGKAVGKNKPVPQVPYWLVRSFLPFVRLVNRSLYEKASLFVEVTKKDFLAPVKGKRTLEDYLAEHV